MPRLQKKNSTGSIQEATKITPKPAEKANGVKQKNTGRSSQKANMNSDTSENFTNQHGGLRSSKFNLKKNTYNL